MNLLDTGIIAIRIIADILILSFIIYRIITLSYDPRIIGVILFFSGLFALNVVAKSVGLTATWWISDKFAEYSILALIILFQPELRRSIFNIKIRFFEKDVDRKVLEEISYACKELSEKRYGAIIVLERSVDITPLIHGGKVINAEVSKELILAIFNKTSPTHDGAVVVRKGKISLVGVILPVSTRLGIEYGMRHKAGVGITEETDAISIIISEETGRISIAIHGKLKENVYPEKIPEIIEEEIKGG